MPRPSVIIAKGIRHTGRNCPVQRRYGHCYHCSRLDPRMPGPAATTGQTQRCDVPMVLTGERFPTYLCSRSDLRRLYWDLLAYRPDQYRAFFGQAALEARSVNLPVNPPETVHRRVRAMLREVEARLHVLDQGREAPASVAA